VFVPQLSSLTIVVTILNFVIVADYHNELTLLSTVLPTKDSQLTSILSTCFFTSFLITDAFHSGLSQYHLFQQTTPTMMLNLQSLVALRLI